MEQVNKVTVVFTPEEFAQRGADANARYIRMTENTAIVGSKLGIDRHIIKYQDRKDWINYMNPYAYA